MILNLVKIRYLLYLLFILLESRKILLNLIEKLVVFVQAIHEI